MSSSDRFYIDCEFDGHGGPLLSIAMVRHDGSGLHIRTTEDAHDPWVRDNVMPLMDQHRAESFFVSVEPDYVGGILRKFIGEIERPTILADSPVDIGRFCAAISTGDDGGWACADYPLMRFEVHNVDCYPTVLEGASQHNAWWDAMALRAKLAASADTHPKGEDVKQASSPMSGAVGSEAGETHKSHTLPSPSKG